VTLQSSTLWQETQKNPLYYLQQYYYYLILSWWLIGRIGVMMKIKYKVSLNFKCFIVGYDLNVLCFDLIDVFNILKAIYVKF
jgi:hypothetical protein